MLKLAIFGVLLGASSPIYAAKWVPASAGSTGAIWYVDVDSVQDIKDGFGQAVRKVWIKIDYSVVKTEPAREMKVLYFFNCAEEKAKSVSAVKYRADGIVIDSVEFSYSTYSPVVPETVLSSVMDMVCKS